MGGYAYLEGGQASEADLLFYKAHEEALKKEGGFGREVEALCGLGDTATAIGKSEEGIRLVCEALDISQRTGLEFKIKARVWLSYAGLQQKRPFSQSSLTIDPASNHGPNIQGKIGSSRLNPTQRRHISSRREATGHQKPRHSSRRDSSSTSISSITRARPPSMPLLPRGTPSSRWITFGCGKHTVDERPPSFNSGIGKVSWRPGRHS